MKPSVLPILLLALATCVHAPPRSRARVDVLVIAPHPDDEVLLAGGVLERAVRSGRRAAVIVVTNGDLTCAPDRDGFRRQAESLAALNEVGLAEDQVHFLGYPDGFLNQLGATPLAPVERRDQHGACSRGAFTYANHGAGHLDEHTARTGAPAAYTAEALTADLTALLERLRPSDVYLPHAIDAHPDHAMTYTYFRRALDGLAEAPRVHRGVVHAGLCWPSDCATAFVPHASMPPLGSPYLGYAASEQVPIDGRRKGALLMHYGSQLGPVPLDDWLMSFARSNEVFFPERYERRGPHWVPVGSTDSLVEQTALESFARFPVAAGPLTLNTLHAGEFDELSLFGAHGFIGQVVVPAGTRSSSR